MGVSARRLLIGESSDIINRKFGYSPKFLTTE